MDITEVEAFKRLRSSCPTFKWSFLDDSAARLILGNGTSWHGIFSMTDQTRANVWLATENPSGAVSVACDL